METNNRIKRYTVGYLFDSLGESVALIRKNRPVWQEGKWNGIGGKVEPLADGKLYSSQGRLEETPLACMNREFREETGVEGIEWELFAKTVGPSKEDPTGWEVYYFKSFDTLKLSQIQTITDEGVLDFPVNVLPPRMVLHNRWLIPMALNSGGKIFTIYETQV